MHLRSYALICTLALFSAGASQANELDDILNQLRAQGYIEIEVERTLLGRIRIEADGVLHEREIILNRRSYEILRDFSEPYINHAVPPPKEENAPPPPRPHGPPPGGLFKYE